MSDASAEFGARQSPRTLHENGVVLPGLLCHQCSYDLRSLPVDGRCPECGLEIRLSIQRRRILSLSPWWLRTIRTGAKGLHFAVILLILSALPFCAAAMLHNKEVAIVGLCMLVAQMACAIWSAWLFTAPAPHVLSERRLSHRRVARAAVLGILLSLLVLSLAIFERMEEDILWVFLLLPPFGLLGLWGMHAWCGYCGLIADELGASFPAGRARAYRIGYFAGAGCAVLGFAFQLVGEVTDIPDAAPALGYGAGVLLLCIFLILAEELPNYLTRGLDGLITEVEERR